MDPTFDRIPTDYAILLVRFARGQGIDLLEGSTTTIGELEASEHMSLPLYTELMGRYTALQTEPDWGFRLGQQFSIASHGALGFGALAAPTIGDGLNFLARYMPSRTSYTTASAQPQGSALHIVFRHHDAMLPFRQRICETLSVVFQSYIETAGAATTPLVWRFPFPQPEHHTTYGHWLHGGYTFDADALRLEVPGSVAMIASAFRNDAAFRASQAQCELLLPEARADTAAGRVRSLLASHIERRLAESVPVTEIPTADEIAQRLQVSRRTLIRQLGREGESFQGMKDELLRAHIERLLAAGELPLAEIGHRLGYADAANFTRACRRMFGATPRSLRSTLRAARIE